MASVVWLWRTADFSLVLSLLESAHPVALGLAVLLLGMSLMMKSFRWRTLLPAEPGISPGDAYRIFHISILLNNLLPFRLGDGARVVSGPVRRAATAQQALVVLVLERLLDGIVLVCVAM
ncbi:MAG: lysylphosphatidylglycerol synthase domain-containing protein, partial [Dehalococcoidia bacterium]